MYAFFYHALYLLKRYVDIYMHEIKLKQKPGKCTCHIRNYMVDTKSNGNALSTFGMSSQLKYQRCIHARLHSIGVCVG